MYSHDTATTYSFSILPDYKEYPFLRMWLGMTPPPQAGTEYISSHEPSSVYDDTIEYETIDEYIENTPLEARFDIATLQLLVEEGIDNHRAYHMTFDEYLAKRSGLRETDNEGEKKRLSIYLPLFPSMRTADFAYHYNMPVNTFLTRVIEHGLIVFRDDYREDINLAIDAKANMTSYLTSRHNQDLYVQLAKQTIDLGTCSGVRNNGSKHFTPYVQEWFYNSINDKAASMNMTVSDISYVCWCVGVTKKIDQAIVDPMTTTDCTETLDKFNRLITLYTDRINELQSKFITLKALQN